MSIAPEHDQRQRQDQNQSLGGLDPNIPKNEPVTPDNAQTPDSMTPPTAEERERQKSYAQIRNQHETTEREKAEEEARIKAEPKIAGGRFSIAMQPQPVPVHRGIAGIRPSAQGEIELREGETPSVQHLEDMVLLPKFAVDDARKLKGGEGQQFRIDAVKMVEAETARVAQLHEIVGTSDIHLGCDGLPTDPPNDFTNLDAALAAAQAQVEVQDDGDSDVKEIALISAALMETARYWAIEGAEQLPPPEADAQRRRDADPNFDPNLPPRDPPIGQTAEPQWKTGE